MRAYDNGYRVTDKEEHSAHPWCAIKTQLLESHLKDTGYFSQVSQGSLF